MASEIRLTREGYEKLKRELEELRGPERMRIAEAIREAKSHGDLRENAAYHEAKLNQRRLDSRIAELEKALQLAKVVEQVEGGSGARLGCMVLLLDLDFDDEFHIKLVGAFESDASLGHISIDSPLGLALHGKDSGDEIEVDAPAGMQRYKVIRVE